MGQLSTISFRAFLESTRFCRLELSPVVAALADAMDGRTPTSIDDELARRVFGCVRSALPQERKRIVGLVAGGQGGKTSRLGAPRLLHLAWTVPLPNLRPGQIARGAIFAPDRDLAMAALDYCKGYVMGSAVLRDALVIPERGRRKLDEEDEEEWEDWPGAQERIRLRRPDGAMVEIVIKAAARGGTGARSRSLFGVLIDEAAFLGDEFAAVNDKDILDAARHRVVPGGQIVLASTPWDEDIGELMRLARENIGRHEEALVAGGSADHHVTTRDLFPAWDPDSIIEPDILRDPARHSREVLGIPLKSGSSRWFDAKAVDAAFKMLPLSGSAEARGAGSDFAFERDHCATAIVDRYEGERFDLRDDDLIVPGKDGLKPSVVCKATAALCARNGVSRLVADGHYRKSVEEHLEAERIGLDDAPGGNEGKYEVFTLARDVLAEGRLRLAGARDPLRMKANMARVLKQPLPGGRWKIFVPRSKGHGHADDVSALVLAVWQAKRAESENPAGLAEHNAEMNVLMTNPRRAPEPSAYADRGRENADMWTNPRYC